MTRKHLLVVATLALTLVLAALAWLKLPLWRDTIIRSAEGGTLIMASGDEYPTNRWFSQDEDFKFSQLQTRREDDGNKLIHYIVQNYDEEAKARLRIGDTEYLAILDGTKWSSATNNAEYFLRTDRQTNQAEQGVAPQSATRSESDSEGGHKPQPESEPRPR